MSKYILIALAVMTAAHFRHKYNQVDLPWQQRILRGAFAGMVVAIALVLTTIWQFHFGQRTDLELARLGWVCLLVVAAGSISLLRGGPADSPESFEFDDPDNISPGDRVRMNRQAHETRNK
jgi:type IV secretory pathway VirB2 component (pilin)